MTTEDIILHIFYLVAISLPAIPFYNPTLMHMRGLRGASRQITYRHAVPQGRFAESVTCERNLVGKRRSLASVSFV
jgi:hypothetical protein